MKRLPVEVSGISGCAPYQGYVVILRELNGVRLLPIFIGVFEAHNINLLLQGVKTARPLTYDFCRNLLYAAEARVVDVTVCELRENTFFAKVELEMSNGASTFIDARPSDAIALAMRMKAPIFVADSVMNEAGFTGSELPRDMPDLDDSERKLHELNQQLHVAVENEAYEDAARLRDKIRELEAKSASV